MSQLSTNAVAVMDSLRAVGASVELRAEGGLRVVGPKGAINSDLRVELEKYRTDIIATLAYRERLTLVKARVRQAMDETARRYPKASLDDKRRGCVTMEWQAVHAEARETEERLNETMLAVARGEAGYAELEAAWKAFVRARLERWKDCMPARIVNGKS